MKRLIIALTVALLGCGTLGSGSGDYYNTLQVYNSSGDVVRVFANDGIRYSLGRAYPGPTCMRLRVVSSQTVRFGIQHRGDLEVWQPTPFANDIGLGWTLEIQQPSQAYYDILGILPAPRCR